MVQSFFAKIRYYKVKLQVGNSTFTEINELKILNLRVRFFECKFFTFITLNPSGKTRLILK